MKYLIFYYLIVCTFCYNITTCIDEKQSSESTHDEKIFMKYFALRRSEQIQAVNSWDKLNIEHTDKMINAVAKKLFEIIDTSKTELENNGIYLEVTHFPANETLKNTLANVMENTALFSEIFIRHKQICRNILKRNSRYDFLFNWGFTFCANMKHLLDKNTIRILGLVYRELYYLKRGDLDFTIDSAEIVEEEEADVTEKHSESPKKEKKKRKKHKKGPQISRSDL